jgi:hypothetical protein
VDGGAPVSVLVFRAVIRERFFLAVTMLGALSIPGVAEGGLYRLRYRRVARVACAMDGPSMTGKCRKSLRITIELIVTCH